MGGARAEAAVIVCERDGRWAWALSCAWPAGETVGAERPVAAWAEVRRETRSLEECWQEVIWRPASVVVLELWPQRLTQQVDFLLDLGREFPAARAVVLAERCQAGYEWLLREAGAWDFRVSPRQLVALGRSLVRHVHRAGRTVAVGVEAGPLTLDELCPVLPTWARERPGLP